MLKNKIHWLHLSILYEAYCFWQNFVNLYCSYLNVKISMNLSQHFFQAWVLHKNCTWINKSITIVPFPQYYQRKKLFISQTLIVKVWVFNVEQFSSLYAENNSVGKINELLIRSHCKPDYKPVIKIHCDLLFSLQFKKLLRTVHIACSPKTFMFHAASIIGVKNSLKITTLFSNKINANQHGKIKIQYSVYQDQGCFFKKKSINEIQFLWHH